jgi:hypothetical protein
VSGSRDSVKAVVESLGPDVDEFDYFAWRKLAESFPCAPAKGLPKLAAADAVILHKLEPQLSPTEVAARLEDLVVAAIAANAHLCVATVPAWRSEADLAHALIHLRNDHGWELKRLSRGLLSPTAYFRVGLHRRISEHPSDGRAIESVPMVLGPFAQFPKSRYCPVPVFEMSVCTDGPTKLIEGRYRINFLGIPLAKLSNDQREALIQRAKEETAAVNGGADVRAKPNVTATFAMSTEPLFN